MRKLILIIVAALTVGALMLAGTAMAGKPVDGGKIVTPMVNDPGDGGGTYPYYTGYCGLLGSNTPFKPGDSYYFGTSGRRDKCYNDGFMHVQFYSAGATTNPGGYWYDAGNQYD